MTQAGTRSATPSAVPRFTRLEAVDPADVARDRGIDPMAYLPDMDVTDSPVLDELLARAAAFDFDAATEADVRAALAADRLSPEGFGALLSSAAEPLLEELAAAARRARAKRRRRRQLALIGTACGILVVSGVITALLPTKGADAPLTSDAPANTRLVAPVPYAGSNGSTGTAQALNWGTVGPQRQSADTGYTYTALPAAPAALPAFGRVDTSWFADAAFLGDSLPRASA